MSGPFHKSSRQFLCVSLVASVAAGTSALAKAQDSLSSQITVPGIMQTETGSKTVEITLYDAETVARINEADKVAMNATQAMTVTQESPVKSQVNLKEQADTIRSVSGKPGVEPVVSTEEASIVSIAPKVEAKPVSLPSKVKAKYPRDISDQVFEVIAGVPIIENPKKCDTDELDVDVVVTNVSDSEGTIVADLHNDVEEDFLVWDRVVLRVRMPAQKGQTKLCMPLTEPGDYAIAVYHDKNGNKEFDKNFLGLPKERFGMSRDPKFGTRSPELEETIFTVPETGADIKITLFSTGDILGGQKKK